MAYKNQIMFCPLPANKDKTYSAASLADATLVDSATDRLNTFSEHLAYWCDLTSQPKVNFVYVKATGIDTLRIYDGLTLVGSVDEPAYTVTTQQGETSDYAIDGYAHYLIPLTLAANTKFRTTNLLKINVTGATKKIYEIACLFQQDAYSIQADTDTDADNQVTRLDIQPTWRNYTSRPDIDGQLDFIPPLNKPPIRYITELGTLYDDAEWQALMPFFYDNAEGFALVQEYGRYPARIYTKAGLHPNFSTAIQRLVDDLKKYTNAYITIAEA